MNFKKRNFYISLAIFSFVLLVYLLLRIADKSDVPKIENGIFKVNDENALEVISLSGEVDFYWNKFLTYSDYIADKYPSDGLIHTGKRWSEFEINGKKLPKYGYASYVFEMEFDQDQLGKEFGIEILPFTTAALEIEVNGKIVASRGVLGTTREKTVSGGKNVVFSFYPDSPTAVFIVRVAEFTIHSNGYFPKMNFGLAYSVQYEKRTRFFVDIAMMASMLIMIINNSLFFVVLREKRILTLSLAFVVLLFLNLISGEKIIYNFTGDDFFLFFLKTGDSFLILFFLFLNMSFYFFFEGLYRKKTLILIVIFNSLFIPPYFLLPAHESAIIFSFFVPIMLGQSFFLIYVAIKGIRRKVESSLGVLMTISVTLIASFSDYFLYLDVDAVPWGLENYLVYRPIFFYALVPFLFIFTFIMIKRYDTIQKKEAVILKIFKKFVPSNLMLNKAIEDIQLGDSRNCGVFLIFFDIVGFSKMCANLDSVTLFNRLNSFYDFIFNVVEKTGGVISRFIGDGVLIVFETDSNKSLSKQSYEIMEICLLMFKKIKEFNSIKNNALSGQKKTSQDRHKFSIRLMLHLGEVTIASIGSKKRMDISVLGDDLNFIFKMEEVAKKHNLNFVFSKKLLNPAIEAKWSKAIELIKDDEKLNHSNICKFNIAKQT